MSKKKIYYVLFSSVVAGQTNSPAPSLFGTLEEAKKAYTNEKKEIRAQVKSWSKTDVWGKKIHKETYKSENELKDGKAFFQIFNSNSQDNPDNMQVELGYEFVEMNNKLYEEELRLFNFAKGYHKLKDWAKFGINKVVLNNKEYWDSQTPRRYANTVCELDYFEDDEDGFRTAYLKEVE